jgi:hypothetical protein
MMLGQTLYGKDGLDCSGSLVDLSPDDNTLAFGSPGYYEDGDRTGYVRVFALKVGIDNNIGTTHLEADGRRHRWRLVVILCGALFYVTVTFSFLLVYDTSKKKVLFFPLKLKA